MPTTTGDVTTQRTLRTEGPTCRQCRQSEAKCAYLAGCCSRCSHWRHLDANGDDRHGNRPDCGTSGGYDSHRYRREAACGACKSAHSADVQRRNQLRVVA